MRERHFRIALLVLGHGVFATLLALAWKHGLIRSTHGDTAFQVFQWISQPGWDIEAHRYTAILPQACVKLFALFGVELRTLLLVASLAHVLVGYAVYVLCAHVWRAPVSAFACALAAVLCSRLAFYSPVLEANYLLCYPFLLMGFLEHRASSGRGGARDIMPAIALLPVPLLAHPVGWMVMLFCIAFWSACFGLERRMSVPLLSIAAIWPLLSRWLFPPTGYEQEQYDGMMEGFGRLGAIGQWGSWDFLAIHTFSASTTYLPALLVLLAVAGAWFLLRRPLLAFLALGGALAFLFAFLVTFHKGNSALMQDRGILPVATIIALSAAAAALRAASPRSRMTVVIIAAAVLFIKIRDISFASRPLIREYAVTDELIRQAEDQRIARGIIGCDGLREQQLELSWAFPVEILLRSAVRGPEHACVLVCSDDLPAPHMLRSGQLQVLQYAWAVDKNGNRYFRKVDSPYVHLVQH